MSIKNSKQLFLPVVFLFIYVMSYAQSFEIKSVYGEFGLGLSSIKFNNGDLGININGSLNIQGNNSIYSIGYLHTDEFTLFIHPSENIKMVNLTYGQVYNLSDNHFLFIYKGGISYLQLIERTNQIIKSELFETVYISNQKTGFGLPLEFGVQSNLFKYFGVSTKVFLNVNSVKSFYGFTTNLCVGLL